MAHDVALEPSRTSRWEWGLLGAIVAVYLVIATLFAINTPPWQVPDEPAHYNYIAQIVDNGCCPVIRTGDWDQAYLEELKGSGFPDEADLSTIEYEDHQPPLYYLLGAPLFALTDGDLTALRLYSVVLGAGVVVLTYLIVARLLPARREVALASAAFVAFVPQHVAMMSGVNNDSLAELVLGLNLLALISYVTRQTGDDEAAQRKGFHPALLGLLVGVAFLTKVTIYHVVLLAALAILLRKRREGRSWGWFGQQGAWAGGVALAMGLVWWVRDVIVYGWPDVLGLSAHDRVVVDQLRTSDFLSVLGRGPYLREYATTTFHSFWGQFGWMGVPMPPRTYLLLGIFSVWVIVGLLGLLVWFRQSLSLVKGYRDGVWLLVALIAMTSVGYIGYNFTFVQFQGRYLFTALPSIGLGVAVGLLGWSLLLRRRWALLRWLPLGMMSLLAFLDVFSLYRFIVPNLS